MRRNNHSSKKSPTKPLSLSNLTFALSLVCPYLMAKELLCLSLTCPSLRFQLKSGSARTIRYDFSGIGSLKAKLYMDIFRNSFSSAKELILVGSREEILFALQGGGASQLPLTRLSLHLKDYDNDPDRFLDGITISASCGEFLLLERLEIKNIGPYSSSAFLTCCTSSKFLKMIRLSFCPTLMDNCLTAIIANAPMLTEMTIEEAPSLHFPKICSNSLVRLKLSKCFSLFSVDVSEAKNLTILDIPWTVHLIDCPNFSLLSHLRHFSLTCSRKLERMDIYRIPSLLSSLDLSYCSNLKYLHLGNCKQLVYLNLTFCVNLQIIVLQNLHSLEELDLSLLKELKLLELYEDYSLTRLVVAGCDKLEPSCVTCSLPLSRLVRL